MRSLQELVSELRRYSDTWRVAEVHGQLEPSEKENILFQFQSGEFDILVATTIIEVGIDIPNACMMIIENPERFGMAQLHQLRGRVGRGSRSSWCFLVLADSDYPEATFQRLNSFIQTGDGFKIAEMDLSQRGAGDIAGVRQSGFGSLRFVDILTDFKLIQEVRNKVDAWLAEGGMQTGS